MEAKIIAALSSPLTWLFLTAFVGPELVRLLLSGEAFGVQFFTKLGNAPAADLTALIGDGAQGIVKAVSAGKTPADALQNAKAAVLTLWSQQSGRALKDVEAELGLLVEGKLTLHANLAPAVLVAPGGAAVALPKGFVGMGTLGFLVAVLALLGVLLGAERSFAQAVSVTPPAMLTAVAPPAFTLGPIGNAIRLPWGGGAPVQIAPGAGFQVSWNVPGTWWTLPVIGKVPALALGGVVLGSIEPVASGSSYNLSLGPLLTICHMIGLGLVMDAVAVAPGGSSGFLAGKVGLPNVAGVLLYTQQIGSAAELNLAPASP